MQIKVTPKYLKSIGRLDLYDLVRKNYLEELDEGDILPEIIYENIPIMYLFPFSETLEGLNFWFDIANGNFPKKEDVVEEDLDEIIQKLEKLKESKNKL